MERDTCCGGNASASRQTMRENGSRRAVPDNRYWVYLVLVDGNWVNMCVRSES